MKRALISEQEHGVPVGCHGPKHNNQEHTMLPRGTETAMEEKRQVRTKDRRQALGEIPVPGVGSVERGQLMQNVEFQKVEGNYNPLQEREKEQSGCPIRGMPANFPCTPWENIREPHQLRSPFSRAKKVRVRSD